ncbi:hypothetical protein SAMN05216188_101319 [Lentzea xinjiangensis]|uniref:Uncharacterized protein n=1 Tax=Lentzea xinjiangensis TaxID=402600 RepID=A0A1H9AA27_9PSEU|nr:hypothetical protein [Lentzea xinjiangensis]SEP73347.1 hypothetical protein SAMN05216188_101319 [Lentzea xinjiangensis]
MRPSRPEWASLLVVLVDAIVIAYGFVAGSPMLPRAANVVLVVVSGALMLVVRFMVGGGSSFRGLVRPPWMGAVALVAFFGGALLFAIPLLTGIPDTSDAAGLAANQRGWVGLALAFAGGTLAYAAIRRPDEEPD